MVAEPVPTPVTRPVFGSTVATEVLEDDQVSDLSVAFDGDTVAVSVFGGTVGRGALRGVGEKGGFEALEDLLEFGEGHGEGADEGRGALGAKVVGLQAAVAQDGEMDVRFPGLALFAQHDGKTYHRGGE